jgi:hypothetical protein
VPSTLATQASVSASASANSLIGEYSAVAEKEKRQRWSWVGRRDVEAAGKKPCGDLGCYVVPRRDVEIGGKKRWGDLGDWWVSARGVGVEGEKPWGDPGRWDWAESQKVKRKAAEKEEKGE